MDKWALVCELVRSSRGKRYRTEMAQRLGLMHLAVGMHFQSQTTVPLHHHTMPARLYTLSSQVVVTVSLS